MFYSAVEPNIVLLVFRKLSHTHGYPCTYWLPLDRKLSFKAHHKKAKQKSRP